MTKNTFNDKHKCIPLEEMKPGGLYTLTFNPEEQPLVERFYNIKLNTLSGWSNLNEERLTTLRYAEIDIVTEISSKGRLHYHGYIYILDPVNFIFYDLRKLKHYGTYEIDHINNEDVWRTYVYKQQEYMEKWCKLNDMSYRLKSK